MNKNQNIIKEKLPYFSEYRRVYIFENGTEVTFEDYWAYRYELKRKQDEQIAKMNLENTLQCIEASEIMNDMLNGYAPSVAYLRASRRNKNSEAYFDVL